MADITDGGKRAGGDLEGPDSKIARIDTDQLVTLLNVVGPLITQADAQGAGGGSQDDIHAGDGAAHADAQVAGGAAHDSVSVASAGDDDMLDNVSARELMTLQLNLVKAQRKDLATKLATLNSENVKLRKENAQLDAAVPHRNPFARALVFFLNCMVGVALMAGFFAMRAREEYSSRECLVKRVVQFQPQPEPPVNVMFPVLTSTLDSAFAPKLDQYVTTNEKRRLPYYNTACVCIEAAVFLVVFLCIYLDSLLPEQRRFTYVLLAVAAVGWYYYQFTAHSNLKMPCPDSEDYSWFMFIVANQTGTDLGPVLA